MKDKDVVRTGTLTGGSKYVFFNDTGSCVTTWCGEGRVDSPVTHYLENGFDATHWCALPSETDPRWRQGNPWHHPDAQDVGVLTLSHFYPSGRLGVTHERKRPGAREDVNHPAFVGAVAWMPASELRGELFEVPDVRRAGLHSLRDSASWVLKEKATGQVLCETYNFEIVRRLNTAKYEAVPILDHLRGLNKAIRLQSAGTISIQAASR